MRADKAVSSDSASPGRDLPAYNHTHTHTPDTVQPYTHTHTPNTVQPHTHTHLTLDNHAHIRRMLHSEL